MHVGMSERFLERDDLDAAVQHLVISKEMGEHLGSRQNPYRWCVAMARTRAVDGDPAACARPARRRGAPVCRRLLPEDPADRRVEGTRLDRSGTVGRSARLGAAGRPVGRGRAGLRPYVRAHHPRAAPAGRGEAGRSRPDADAGVGTPGPSARGGSRGREDGRRHRDPAAAGARPPDRGDVEAALVPLRRALVLAEPEGYVRLFLDEGQPMAVLLESLHDRAGSSPYVQELLTSFGRG